MVLLSISSVFAGSSNLFTCLIKCCSAARCQSERKQKQNFVTRHQKYICDAFPDLSQVCFSPFFRGQERGSPTFFFHASPEAFVEPAETTLVPLILIHNALPAEPEQIQRTITWEKKKVHCIIMQFKMPRCNALEGKINNVGCVHMIRKSCVFIPLIGMSVSTVCTCRCRRDSCVWSA